MSRLVHGGLAKWTVGPDGVITRRSYHERALATGAPSDVIAGLDILDDDGMPIEKAAELLVAAHRDGDDAEAFARHLVKLRKAMRGAA